MIPASLVRRLLASLPRISRAKRDLAYWEERARKFRERSVYNLRHQEGDLANVTRQQIDTLFPILRRQLRGDERVVLDFGCGPGRFTLALAELIGGRAIGVDPIASLLELAPRAENVSYMRLAEGRIPLDDASVDIVWASLVLGAITGEDALRAAAAEIERVLRPEGLFFLVDNTAEKPSVSHYSFRSVAAYAALFPSIPLHHEADYVDAGERISVMVGRKVSAAPAPRDPTRP